MDVETFVVNDLPADVTALQVVTYVSYVLCAVMMPACMRTFGVHTVMGSKIGVRPIVASNIDVSCLFLKNDVPNFEFKGQATEVTQGGIGYPAAQSTCFLLSLVLWLTQGSRLSMRRCDSYHRVSRSAEIPFGIDYFVTQSKCDGAPSKDIMHTLFIVEG